MPSPDNSKDAQEDDDAMDTLAMLETIFEREKREEEERRRKK